MAKKRRGRKKGGHNRGFYFRMDRGWCAVEGARRILLHYDNGDPIRDKNADNREVRKAYARYLLDSLTFRSP